MSGGKKGTPFGPTPQLCDKVEGGGVEVALVTEAVFSVHQLLLHNDIYVYIHITGKLRPIRKGE